MTYNNLTEDDAWSKDNKSEKTKCKGKIRDTETTFLALATQIVNKFEDIDANDTSGRKPRGGTFASWRYENPNNETTMVVKGTTIRWCTQDFHP